jgi:hypothetical protein
MPVFTQGQAIDFIEKTLGQGISSNSGLNISVLCPRCKSRKPYGYNKKKLVIKTDDFKCHCWVCGLKSSNIFPILAKYFPHSKDEFLSVFGNSTLTRATLLSAQGILDEEDSPVILPPECKILGIHQKEYRYHVDYLVKRRGLTEKEIFFWKILVSDHQEYKNRIIIPSFDSEGDLNYFTARKILDKGRGVKYKNPEVDRSSIIFNEMNIDWTKPLVLVEGPFDLLKVGINATCLLGSELNENYLLFQRICENKTEVILSLDLDAKSKEQKIAKLLFQYNVKVKILEIPEEYDDIGELPLGRFNDLIESAKLYSRLGNLKDKISNIV